MKLDPNKTYIAIPFSVTHRTPFLFKGARRENQIKYKEEDGISNCWPFDYDLIEHHSDIGCYTGVNDNDDSHYSMNELDSVEGQKALDEYLLQWAKLTYNEGHRLHAITQHEAFKWLRN